ncbi:hypothetical protein AB0P21_19820 [Kribbella sp. NPDC056861]|uniref:terpene synthase family protein n=1 Tax=Kribbella sp. NPDC056861 TaxID=3154857 RepID=UPI0034236F8D
MPFPLFAAHPDAQKIQRETVSFLNRFQLFWDDKQRKRIEGINTGLLAAMQVPTGPTDRLQCLADFLTWVFAWDDEYCDDRPIAGRPGEHATANAMLQRAVEITEYQLDSTDRYGKALRDIRLRLEAATSPNTGEAFTELVLGYLRTELRRVVLADVGLSEDLSAYVSTRIVSGGALVFPMLAVTVACSRNHPALSSDRRVRALFEMAAFLTAGENDIFSFPKEKELTLPGKTENLVHVLATEHDLTVGQALTEAAGILNSTAGLYLRLRADILRDAPADLALFVSALDNYWNGSVLWQRDCPRYLYLDSSGRHVLPRPTTDALGFGGKPLTIPSIAWWWQYDPRP